MCYLNQVIYLMTTFEEGDFLQGHLSVCSARIQAASVFLPISAIFAMRKRNKKRQRMKSCLFLSMNMSCGEGGILKERFYDERCHP